MHNIPCNHVAGVQRFPVSDNGSKTLDPKSFQRGLGHASSSNVAIPERARSERTGDLLQSEEAISFYSSSFSPLAVFAGRGWIFASISIGTEAS